MPKNSHTGAVILLLAQVMVGSKVESATRGYVRALAWLVHPANFFSTNRINGFSSFYSS